jgi:UDP:flavonoid glycosyltransferase YjiC (YdhE family)
VRVLFVCHDAGGTVPPVVALAEALVRDDYDVVVLAQPSVRQRAEAIGATFQPFSELGDYRHRASFDDQLDLIGTAIVGRSLGDDALQIPADLVVVDANLAGALAAVETRDVPTAVLLHSMYATYVDTWFADLWPLVGGAVNDVRGSFGLDSVDGWPAVFAGHDRLVSVVPDVFDAPVSVEVPPTLRHSGFLVRHEDPRPDELPAGEGPAVLVGLSTTYQAHEELLATIVDALGRLPVRALVTTAGQVDVHDAPSNVRVVDRVPHVAVLPQIDVMVTHAGLGSVAAALHHGVPLVCTPIDRDQPLNAARVEALGAGIALGATPTVEEIVSSVTRILDEPAWRSGARRVADASAAAGGAVAAARDLVSL